MANIRPPSVPTQVPTERADLAPDNLEWECLGFGLTDFIDTFLTNRIATFIQFKMGTGVNDGIHA